MTDHEQVKKEDETRLIEDYRSKITIPNMYQVHRDESIQVLSEFEDM